MSWLGLLKAGLSALITLSGWLKERQAINTASAEIISKHLKGAFSEVQRATEIRDSVRNNLSANPDELRSDDGFKRLD